MPAVIIDIPSGLETSAKEQLHKDAFASMHHAYQMPDCRVFLREWAAEHACFDDGIGGAFRPICHDLAPPILTAESRQTLVSSMSSAVNRAGDLRTEVVKLPGGEEVSTQWVLQFFFEVPLELAALDGLMESENPIIPKSKHWLVRRAWRRPPTGRSRFPPTRPRPSKATRGNWPRCTHIAN